jgi:hypothetical protein
MKIIHINENNEKKSFCDKSDMYTVYQSHMSNKKVEILSNEEWLKEIYILQLHLQSWMSVKDDDILMNCDVLPNYSNKPYLMIDKSKHSYFIRKDFVVSILQYLDINNIFLPIDRLLFEKNNEHPSKHLTMLVHGGFGNRLFHIAMAYGSCKKYNLSFDLYLYYNSHSQNNYADIFKLFDNVVNFNKNVPCIKEDANCTFDKDPNVIYEIQKHNKSVVYGYFQSSEYFREYREDILQMFKIPPNINAHIDKQYSNINECWFIHVRLTDYVYHNKRDMHFIDLNDYYKECLRKINRNDRIYLFSDDTLSNVKKYYPFFEEYEHIEHVNEKNELIAFYMMMKCGKGGICANSTFSWWASYLNDNPLKIVYKPDKFVNGYKGNFNM